YDGICSREVLGVCGNHDVSKVSVEILVHPTTAVISAVVIGHGDEIHGPAALIFGDLGEILSHAKQTCASGTVVERSVKVSVDVGNHDDRLVRHALKLANYQFLMQIRIVLVLPNQMGFNASSLRGGD